MSDFKLDKEIGGKPAYLWIGGGVVVAYAFYAWRQRQTPAADSNAGADTSLMTGSAGGTGLAYYDGTGVPGSVGITAPTPTPAPTPVVPKTPKPTKATRKPTAKTPAKPTVKPKSTSKAVPVPAHHVTSTPAPAKVSASRRATTQTHRGYTNKQLAAARARKTATDAGTLSA